MSRWFEPTKKQVKSYTKWCAERPPQVRDIAVWFPPWELYRLKPTGQIVYVVSFYEDGTLKIAVTGQFNAVMFDRCVFGIDPKLLEPCDPPPPNARVGTLMTPEQVDENRDALRVAVRPDLWRMGDDGKAIWLGQGGAP